MSTIRTTCLAGLLGLLCCGAGGCRESNAFVPPPPPKVTVQQPVVREVTTYERHAGRLAAIDTVEVRARVKGFLQSVDFEPGQMVRGPSPDDPDDLGDLLFTIEPDPFEAAVNSAAAELAQREAARGLADVTLQRGRVAFEKQAVNEIEMAGMEAELDAAEAAVAAAAAALDTAKIDLAYTRIHAPISGRISRELIDVGNLVGSGESTLLTTIVKDDPIYVYMEVSERTLLKFLKDGRPSETSDREKRGILLQLSDGTTYKHEGVVDFAENRVDPSTGTLQVRGTFPNDKGNLYPGLFVRVLVPDSTGEQMLIPEVALLRDLAGTYVLVADESNTVQRRDIKLGDRVDTDRIVSEGLEPGDRVIVNGIQRAIPGNPVDPEEAAAKSTKPSGADG